MMNTGMRYSGIPWLSPLGDSARFEAHHPLQALGWCGIGGACIRIVISGPADRILDNDDEICEGCARWIPIMEAFTFLCFVSFLMEYENFAL